MKINQWLICGVDEFEYNTTKLSLKKKNKKTKNGSIVGEICQGTARVGLTHRAVLSLKRKTTKSNGSSL
jgi:hypothetical protein